MQIKKLFSKPQIIERAFFTWIAATFYFLIVQWIRPLRIDAMSWAMKDLGVEDVKGFIPWIDPGGFGFRFPTMYRIVHNLTIPYVMIFYVIIFIFVFFLFRNKQLTEKARLLFVLVCAAVHVTVLILWAISLSLPYEVLGSMLQSSGAK
jgi:hypothetical protein